MSGRGFFVTGTDTEVGKTLVTTLLMTALRRRGKQVLGMKPVAAGCEETAEGWRNEDVEALRNAASFPVERELMNPYRFLPPISPHLAAAQAGVAIDLGLIAANLERLRRRADAVLVEGAGGWYAPLGPKTTMADLAHALGLPVILVVGLRLGCLNHALLSAEAIAGRGLTLAGWVANAVAPHMACRDENLASLEERLAAPLLGVVPHLAAGAADPAAILAFELGPLLD
jgi:dethiobiotin synthetase